MDKWEVCSIPLYSSRDSPTTSYGILLPKYIHTASARKSGLWSANPNFRQLSFHCIRYAILSCLLEKKAWTNEIKSMEGKVAPLRTDVQNAQEPVILSTMTSGSQEKRDWLQTQVKLSCQASLKSHFQESWFSFLVLWVFKILF